MVPIRFIFYQNLKMPDKKLVSEILLDLIFSLDVNLSENELLTKSLSSYTSKLDCLSVSVFKCTDSETRFFLSSKPFDTEIFSEEILQKINSFSKSGKVFELITAAQKLLYVYSMPDYGLIAFFRTSPFTDNLEQELIPIIRHKTGIIRNVLSKNKETISEKDKLHALSHKIQNADSFPKENPNPVLRLSRDLKLLFANQAAQLYFLEDFGIDQNGIKDNELSNFLNSLLADNLEDDNFYTDRNQRTYNISFRFIRSSEYINIYATDISKYVVSFKEKEEELAVLNNTLNEQRAFYEFILDNIPEDIAVFDTRHRYLYVNPVGIKNPEMRKFMIGKDDFDYCRFRNIPTTMAEKRRALFDDIIQSGQSQTWDDSTVDKEGNKVFIHRKLTPLFDKNGDVSLIIGYGINISQLKIIEEDLIESNKRLVLLENFFKYTKDAFQVSDESGRMVYMNQAASQRLGIPEKEVENYHVWDFEPVFADNQFWFRHVEELRIIKTITIESKNINNKTGVTTYVEVIARHEEIDGKGYIIAVSRDISDRKASEKELIKTKEQLENIMNEISDVIWSVSLPDYNVIYYSPSSEKLSEYPNSEWESDPNLWMKIIHPDDVGYIDFIGQQLKAQGNYDCTYRILTKSGIVKWINNKGKLIFNDQGAPVRMDGFNSDVTKVQLLLERQKQFIKDAPSAIAMLDREMKYITVSEKWIADYGMDGIEVIGKSHYEVFPEISDEWKEIHRKCLGGVSDFRDEDRFQREDGSVTWLKWRINPWFTENNEVGGLIMLTEDITRIKESKEEELRHILKLTQSQNDRLKNFAHIVSHNLRSHSGNIKSLLELLFEEMPELKDMELMEMMSAATDNLMETITHLAEVAALNVKEKIVLSEIDLQEVTQKAIKNVSALALNSEVTIINDLQGDEKILGLPAYLDSIILNFLTNGIKYRSKTRSGYVKVSSEKTTNFLIVKIEDNGLGIDMKKHGSKLFGMYKTFHRNSDARGIGLFITKNQIEAMGGRIEVESTVDVGTTFKIYFPVIED